MEYIRAFLLGGLLCALGQILIDRTTLTPAKILTGYVTAGVLLSALGFYQPLVDWGGARGHRPPHRLWPSAGPGGAEGGGGAGPAGRPYRRHHRSGGRHYRSHLLWFFGCCDIQK